MSERMPLTMDGLEVGLDAFEASLRGEDSSDPSAVKEWGRRCLQAGGWELLTKARRWMDPPLLDWCGGCDGPDDTGDGHVPGCLFRADQVLIDEGLTEHRDGMPQSLRDALVEGWVRLYAGADDDIDVARNLFVCLWDGHQWHVRIPSYPVLWSTGEPHPALGPALWPELTDDERADLLKIWPDFVAWHESPETVRAPWEGDIRTDDIWTGEIDGPDPTRWAHDLNVALSYPGVRAALVNACSVSAHGRGVWSTGDGGMVVREGHSITMGDPSGDRGTYGTEIVREYLAGRLGIQAGDFVGVGPDGRLRRREPGDEPVGVAFRDAAGNIGVQTSGLATVRLPGAPLVLGPVEQIRATQDNSETDEGGP